MAYKYKFNPFTGNFDMVLDSIGLGDMLKSTYDTDDDSIVDKAESLDDGVNQVSIDEITKKLTANINYYVSPTGDDGNDGLSAGNPFATIQHAIDQIPKNLGGYQATIYLADGTYSEGEILLSGFTGGSVYIWSSNYDADLVLIEGDGADSVIFNLEYSDFIYIAYVSLRTAKNYANCVNFIESTGELEDCKFGNDGIMSGGAGIYAYMSLVALTNITNIDANKVGKGIIVDSSTVILDGTVDIGDTFSDVSGGGLITDGAYIKGTDYNDAITKKHAQNTDIALRTDKLTVDEDGVVTFNKLALTDVGSWEGITFIDPNLTIQALNPTGDSAIHYVANEGVNANFWIYADGAGGSWSPILGLLAYHGGNTEIISHYAKLDIKVSDGVGGADTNDYFRFQTIDHVPEITTVGDCDLKISASSGIVEITSDLIVPNLKATGLVVYANNAAAIVGGLVAGDFYRDGGDPDNVCVVH